MNARGVLGWLRHGALPMLLARLCVGGVYVWYGVNKVREPAAFMKALHGYATLPSDPPYWLNLTVVVLPWIEILCGSLLLLGLWLRSAAAMLFVMTVAFTVMVAMRASAIAAAQALPLCGVKFDCGCGVGEVWFCSKLAENSALIVLAALALWSRSRHLMLGRARKADS